MKATPQHRLRLLGTAQLLDDQDQPVALPPKVMLLLTFLALEWGQPQPRELIGDLLWPDLEPAKARSNLRLSLFKLREVVGEVDWLTSDRTSVGVLPDRGLSVDVADLMSGDLPPLEHLPLAHLTSGAGEELDEWLTAWRERVRVALVSSLTTHAEQALADSTPADAERSARRVLEIDPLVEEAHALLVRALLAQGRQTDAVRQVEACREVLADALGIQPSPELTVLVRGSAAGVGHVGTGAEPMDAPLEVVGPPLTLTSFVGRGDEVALLTRRIRDRSSRLLSILGPGGMGKTRLATEVATTCARYFDEGAAFAALDGLPSADDVPVALADALGLQGIGFTTDPAAALVERLGEREVLLVADNVEHLLADGAADQGRARVDAATLLNDLVSRCPYVVVLVTSRTALRLPAEDALVLQGLAFPTVDDLDLTALGRFDAMRLLVDRVHHVDKRIRLDETTAAPLSRIARATEGMPLGLELAAAAVRGQPLDRVADTIGESPASLRGHLAGVPDRHADLGAVYRHSVGLLRAADQAVMRRLAAFRDGFTQGAAHLIAGSDATSLARLLSASLISRDVDGRYRLHELIRQLAWQALAEAGEAPAVTEAHARHHMAMLAEATPALRGPAAAAAQVRIDADAANIRAAWQHLVDLRDGALLAEAAEGLVIWTQASGAVARRTQMLDAAISAADDDAHRAVLALAKTQSLMSGANADRVLATASEAESFAAGVPDNDALLAEIHLRVGTALVIMETDATAAAARVATARAHVARLADPDTMLLGRLRSAEAAVAMMTGDNAGARPIIEDAIDQFEQAGSMFDQIECLAQMTASHVLTHDLGDGLRWARRLVETATGGGQRHIASTGEMFEGMFLCWLGAHEDVIPLMERRLVVLRGVGRAPFGVERFTIGRALVALGRLDEGERAMAEAIAGLAPFHGYYLAQVLLAGWARHLASRERHTESELVALDLHDALNASSPPEWVATAQALRGRALLGQERVDEAVTAIDAAWSIVAGSVVAGSDRAACLVEPLDTLMECHDVFTAAGRAEDASAAVRLARDRMRDVARGIEDPTLRGSFLRTPIAQRVQGAG